MNTLNTMNPVAVTKRLFGLAGEAVGLAGAVTRAAVHAPVGVTKGVIHLVEAGAGLADTVARETGHVARADHSDGHPTYRPSLAGATTASAPGDAATAPPGPTVAPVEPHAPDAPPVDVVGDALAAEAAVDRGQGVAGLDMAHEPHGASRDEEHGDAALQRAEVEEIAEEAATALEGDVETDR